jgi:CBS domain-containing protein
MKLSDLLLDGWVIAPIEATDLEEALRVALARAQESAGQDREWVEELSRAITTGEEGEVVRVGEEVVMVVAPGEAFATPAMGVAVAPEPFLVSQADGQAAPEGARVLFFLLTAGRIASIREQVVPALRRVTVLDEVTRTSLAVVTAGAPVDRIRNALDVDFRSPALVRDAVQPLRYRVYPDTPLTEVMDLMVRRGVHAVPVVGGQYEVLGIMTSGDALDYLLRKGRPGDRREGRPGQSEIPLAKEFMTRTVMCVSEDQALKEAANLMVNRDVEQLPVVREGELIGFVTRDSILRALYGSLKTDQTDGNQDNSDP